MISPRERTSRSTGYGYCRRPADLQTGATKCSLFLTYYQYDKKVTLEL